MKTVQDILEKKGGEVARIDQNETVLAAARLMNSRHIGSTVVTHGEKVIGIFTERDVLNRVVAGGRDPTKTLVREVMTTPVACCTRATSLDECRQVMRAKNIRHLPVVEQGRLFGMVSLGDLNLHAIHEQDETIRYLNDYLYGRT